MTVTAQRELVKVATRRTAAAQLSAAQSGCANCRVRPSAYEVIVSGYVGESAGTAGGGRLL